MAVLVILIHVLAVVYLATIKYRLDVSSNAIVTMRVMKVPAITASAQCVPLPIQMKSVPMTRTASSLQDLPKGIAFRQQSVRTPRMISATKPGLLSLVLEIVVPSVVRRPVPASSQQSASKLRVHAAPAVDLRASGLRGRTTETYLPPSADLVQESVSSSARAIACIISSFVTFLYNISTQLTSPSIYATSPNYHFRRFTRLC